MTGVVRLSRVSYREMIQNHASGVGYNVVVIPLSAGASAWGGLDLSPAVAAILMCLSTIVVALNAQLLRRVDLQPDRQPPPSSGQLLRRPRPASTHASNPPSSSTTSV